MLHQSTCIEIELAVGEALSLFRTEGCLLRCERGTVWLTEENGGQDVILRPGECFLLTCGGRAVVESVDKRQAARCRLVPAQSRRLSSALRRWVRALCGMSVVDAGGRREAG
ncbi:DUF2917 domain-containing protein [uncultured Propionivibrio sp.]|uniref:DUF2917 domain-containing protein n=1 Tax=uncultured Propionivibrio sp. TaxID=426737 RepID=UPI0029C0369F|nr:DUF2917 domain-containing protein [uncultured Propionivibrio sp.]